MKVTKVVKLCREAPDCSMMFINYFLGYILQIAGTSRQTEKFYYNQNPVRFRVSLR